MCKNTYIYIQAHRAIHTQIYTYSYTYRDMTYICIYRYTYTQIHIDMMHSSYVYLYLQQYICVDRYTCIDLKSCGYTNTHVCVYTEEKKHDTHNRYLIHSYIYIARQLQSKRYIYLCVELYIYTGICTYKHLYTYTHISICIYTHIQLYIYIYIHIYIYKKNPHTPPCPGALANSFEALHRLSLPHDSGPACFNQRSPAPWPCIGPLPADQLTRHRKTYFKYCFFNNLQRGSSSKGRQS